MKLWIKGELDDVTTVCDIVQSIIDCKDPLIIVYVNSIGGSPLAGFAIYSALKDSKKRIITHAPNIVYSSAMLPYLAGEIRYATAYSHFLIHEVAFVKDEDEDEDEDEEKRKTPQFYKERHAELEADSDQLFSLIAENSKLRLPKIKKAVDKASKRNWHFYTKDALKYGIVHRVGFPMNEKELLAELNAKV
jgi:ATP-dependent protease ClpP protease subunit